ncbi:Sulfotransferase family protein [Methylocella tundrae]|uniref:Sulfotransferase family protein n=1 Tax=Methylocella tundrae TaxID=227605 RepID=A0A8B6M6M7_METTU|nr:tetratricopeptide repeat-containing sulfotransferase family protein [Methylocella tundrae]VTZ50457.1 Sulfotransferase family protein [Methylocella tundrae]
MTELYHRESEADAAASELRRIEELTRGRRHAEALAAASALLRRAPSQRAALYWAALNQRLLGQAKDALATLDALERAHPNYSLLFQERGHCLAALDDPSRAIASFERAVALNPALTPSWGMLERLLSAAGEPQRASVAAQRLAKLQELPPAIVEAGARFCDGELAAAENLLTSHIAREGRHVEALRLLGRIAQRRGATDRAEELFREVVDAAPGYADARLDYVRILIERQKYQAALEQAEHRLRTEPSDPEARFLRATILAGLGRHDEAISIFSELLSQTPQRNHLRIVLGHSLKALGRAEEAVRAYKDATGVEADIGDAYWSLANLKTYRFSDDEVARMRGLEALSRPGLPDRAHLCFALGKALEDRGDYGGSWAFYDRGNSLVRAKSSYRPEAIEGAARRLLEVCSEEFFAARTGAGAAARDPIFIVGLPRSGSTLLEQILASHPDVDGTQELHDIPRIISEFQGQGSNGGGARYPDLLPGLDPLLFERLGRRYLDETRVYRRGRPRFIDKMPNNFRHIGLIHLMLPNATIIDIRREPMACCVSNLKQLYARGQEFCYGIEEIARYYRTYLELMRHWDRVLPGRVLRVSYEDLVEDLGASVRRILAHCGLEYDPACLAFHRSRRAINTPSSEQVRQPLFREGISQWRNYDPWLDPLRKALGDAIGRHRD